MAANSWTAKWIGPTSDPRQDLGVFAFRKKLQMDQVPDEFLIRISADNRYKLYVNHQLVEFGPQRGDSKHWFYETVDIAGYLKKGANVVWALVWNFGWAGPLAQCSVRTGFVCEGDHLSTPHEWEVARLDGWEFEQMHKKLEPWYIVVGPGERIDGAKLPDYRSIGLQADLDWRKPSEIFPAEERGANGGGGPWSLVPRSIPSMKYDLRERCPSVRRWSNGEKMELQAWQPLGPDKGLLLDFEELLCAYPRIKVSGAPGTKIRLTYAESMWIPTGGKGHRDEIVGKEIQGYQDEFILGNGECFFEPLWWRTFRYIQIDSDHAASLIDFQVMETGYPLAVESSFTSSHPWTQGIWDVGVRTLQRCMGETYFDCPYYEQLQYVGDTRIQALLSYYLTSDRDLPRNSIENFAWSLMENGLTESRYPSRQTQVIPPFSLWWVMMVRDQVMYDRIAGFDNVQRAEIQAVIHSIERLRKSPDESFWNFCDWVPGWEWGVPPGGINSTAHKLLWFLALAAHMQALNTGEEAQNAARMMLRSRLSREFYIRRGFVSHEDDREWEPTEHAEALYRLCQMSLGIEPSSWPRDALLAANAAVCTYYFSFYQHQAMRPENLFDHLAPWQQMIDRGLTTFAEKEEPTRSDCHAWSSHPLVNFFQIVAGVTSKSPGWHKAKIEPAPGNLEWFQANIAHPDGSLLVGYDQGVLTIDSPVPVELVWKGKSDLLLAGSHLIKD